MNTVLQIPLSADLRSKSLISAKEMGFSSLQEAVRVFLTNLATKKMHISIQQKPTIIKLSEKAEKRYLRIAEDIKKGRHVGVAHSVDELMQKLHGR